MIRDEVQPIDIDLFPENVRRAPYAKQFSAFQIRDNGALLQYVPYATRPSPEPLRNLTRPAFSNGRTPFDIYCERDKWTNPEIKE